MAIPRIDWFNFLFNGGRGIRTDQIAGAFVESVDEEGRAVQRRADGTQENVQIRGTGGAAETTDLRVARSPAVGADDAATLFRSATGDFLVRLELSAAYPRIKLTLAAGRGLVGVYDGGVDISGDFTRQAGSQTWLSNRDYAAGSLMLLVRTEAAG